MSNTNFAAVSARSATIIRDLCTKLASSENENRVLRTKLAQIDYEGAVYDLALEMEQRGLNEHMTREEKVASIRSSGNLEDLQRSVKMASATQVSFGSVSERPASANKRSDFESFCLGHDY